jgi:hypothetical protein
MGFDEAGIDAETSVRNMAYDNKIVIASDTRSPDSTGKMNTRGFKNAKNIVGKIIMTL